MAEAEGSFAIAIIGMAGRFPGAPDVDAFWQNLKAGVESIERPRDEALLDAGVSREDLADPRYVRARGALRDVDRFDAAFFGLSPREAEETDPQQRLFLEHAWEAFERAGYDPARIDGEVGVFAGAGADGYRLLHLRGGRGGAALGALSTTIGNDPDHLTLRVAYKLDLRGPCLTVQTACSTSLVAVVLACQSLLAYQCEVALAGGVSIAFPLGAGHRYEEGHILSPDGRCRAFDAIARGTVGGDGVGVVVLKRLDDAIAAGDHVHAVILGAAMNNDGAAKVGYTAPSVDGQARVIAAAQALAGVRAETISYVETHGTGTPLGDAIEMAALQLAFAGDARRGACAIGSVKPNIGHLNTASGVASLVKATLALEHRTIPPSLHCERPNPEIDFAAGPFFVNTTLRSWEANGAPRRAGVSAFGFGGTNAHVVLEEAPALPAARSARAHQVIVLSARTASALDAAAARLAAHLTERPQPIDDVAFTLSLGRRAFAHRRAIVCRDAADAVAALADPARAIGGVVDGAGDRKVAFLFPGQGAQHAGMAAALYRDEPVFRRALDRAAELAAPRLGWDLRRALAPDAGDDLTRTALAQPALFAVEWALAQLWISLGIAPGAMLGHSLGEYVAACLAGVMDLEGALRIVTARGRLMQDLPEGAMLAVALPEAEIAPLLGADLALAAVNAPSSCVASGPPSAIAALDERLAARGVATKRLAATRAFHSHMMDSITRAFAAEVRAVPLSPPRTPYLSNVTGTWIRAEDAVDPAYWARHVTATVRFSAALEELRRGDRVLLEVGPGRTLTGLAAHRRDGAAPRAIASCDRAGGDDAAAFLGALGELWASGVAVDFAAHHAGERRRRVPLPTYPFERRRFWIDPPRDPSVDDLAALARREAEIRDALAARPLDAYPGLEQALADLCTAYLCDYLRASGLDPAAPARLDRSRLGVAPKHARLFDAAVRTLIEDGVLDENGFTGRAAQIAPGPDHLARFEARYPEMRGLARFVAHCLSKYPDALPGRVDALSVLFPDGRNDVLDALDRDTAAYRSDQLYIRLLVDLVRDLAQDRSLEILEVGGGRGMLTWPLADALRDAPARLHFTDVGRTFIDDARREATRRGLDDRMTFGLLDAGRDPRAQGYESRRFDAIVAYNVVHATRDVAETIGHLASLLAPGGTLAIVEVTKLRRWDMLTWGLADGWWYFDDAFRRESPALDLDGWEDVLRRAGLERVASFPRAVDARARVDHGLVLGRRPRIAETVARAPAPPPSTPQRHPRPAIGAAYVAPRTDVEQRIAAFCAEILGVDRIGVDDDLLELGADSLITLRILDRARRELGLDLPAQAAFRGFTVARIAATSAPPDRELPPTVVPIQPNGSRPPIFFVHPAAGVVFPYVELARHLGPDQPFFGLQARGLDGKDDPDPTIEAMAARYVADLRRVQPRGPYRLGGFSFGCLVAYEVAVQLTRAGQRVDLLALVDEPAPIHGYRPTWAIMGQVLATGIARSIWPYLHDYFYLVNASSDPTPPRALRDGLEGFLARSAMANFVPREHRLLALRQPAMVPMFRLFTLHLQQTVSYQPRAYAGRVTLFTTQSVGRRFEHDPTLGWSTLAAGGVDAHDVPGEHLTVLRPPHVATLAKKLAAALGDPRESHVEV